MANTKTKRTPIGRHARPQITPFAIEAYREMKRLEPLCTCLPGEPPHSCPTCEDWYRMLMVVHLELRARPWEIPCLDPDPPEPDDDKAMRRKHARYLALEAALNAVSP
jgi:hypothetical protein